MDSRCSGVKLSGIKYSHEPAREIYLHPCPRGETAGSCTGPCISARLGRIKAASTSNLSTGFFLAGRQTLLSLPPYEFQNHNSLGNVIGKPSL